MLVRDEEGVRAVRAAMASLHQRGGQTEGGARALGQVGQAFAALFHGSGVARIRLPEGTLVLVSRDPPRFVLEV